mmetsp:Transcript_51417/g.129006  ORF Transcript_51417/g.129006 Transcript_51417/m.129006 type:complete len:357 (-) Transcript_51417:987-2057(-)
MEVGVVLKHSLFRKKGHVNGHCRFADHIQSVSHCLPRRWHPLHHKPHMIELGADSARVKCLIALFKNQNNNIVAKVALPFDLLCVASSVGDESRDMEHDLHALVLGIYRVFPGGVCADIKPCTIFGPPFQDDALPQNRQKMVEFRTSSLVAEHVHLFNLASFAVQHAKLVIARRHAHALKVNKLVCQWGQRLPRFHVYEVSVGGLQKLQPASRKGHNYPLVSLPSPDDCTKTQRWCPQRLVGVDFNACDYRPLLILAQVGLVLALGQDLFEICKVLVKPLLQLQLRGEGLQLPPSPALDFEKTTPALWCDEWATVWWLRFVHHRVEVYRFGAPVFKSPIKLRPRRELQGWCPQAGS